MRMMLEMGIGILSFPLPWSEQVSYDCPLILLVSALCLIGSLISIEIMQNGCKIS